MVRPGKSSHQATSGLCGSRLFGTECSSVSRRAALFRSCGVVVRAASGGINAPSGLLS